jgi:hypothetical protein
MKKLLLILVVSECLLLTSCIDILQHITVDKNGIELNTIQFTVSKAIFEFANKMNENQEPIDYDKYFSNNSDLSSLEKNKYCSSISKINTVLDYGYTIKMRIDRKNKETMNSIEKEKIGFIPIKKGKSYIFDFSSMNDSSSKNQEDNGMQYALLSTAKYKLLISKKMISDIKKLYLVSGSNETEYSYVDLDDEYLVEIPIIIMIQGQIQLRIEI